ncbi:hypothetical protein QSJ19_24910 [Gordonia sp. ABSL11-1]|uniref:hypothetical protein n=1 Tax=Gordonia sp. ABSL11-1 TaxID=3053924 RepID=UPI0025726051|nr:hypothetical protein [Gordonia sp. ABSL11-1]MDL9948767.1 hypothetical protein [Gordonia sp. ABSL11-1]
MTTNRPPLHERAAEARRREAAVALGIDPDDPTKALPAVPILDRARDAADVLDAEGAGHRDGCAVAAALAAVSSAESADRTAAALESIVASLAVIAEGTR